MKNLVKTSTVFQMEYTECGAASLAMILAYYGKYVSLEQMRIETCVSRDGCSAANIQKASRKFGCDCKAFRKRPETLRKMKMPCIIHWNDNHFVVLEGFKSDKVYINDPAMGRRKISFDELCENFRTGVVLTFEPNENFVKEKKKSTLLTFMRKHIGEKESIVKLIVIGLVLVFPGLISPVLSQVFLDEVLIKGNNDWFVQLIVFICATAFLKIALSTYKGLFLIKLQRKNVLLSTREFLYKMFCLPISFFDQRSTGELCNRINSNSQVSDFISGDLAEIVLNIFIAAFYLVLLLIYNPVLTSIAVLVVAVNASIIKISSDSISNISVKYQQDAGKMIGVLNAGLNLTDTIKASGSEVEYVGKILGCNAEAISTEQSMNRSQHIISTAPEAVGMIANILILLIGGLYVVDGKMTIGMLVAFTSLYGSFSEPVNALVGSVKKMQTAKADISRIEDIENYKSDFRFEKKQISEGVEGKLEGHIELENISFGYNVLKPPMVSNINIKIDCGKSVAFVGPSGCGKSTLTKVICGLYEPWSGKVKVDGIPMENIPLEVINASFSTVSQQITLFSGSVRDNMTMWNSNISESDIIAAAKDACIHDVISTKPGGYDFRLSEGGANLSGGQRQRLEIARALVTNPTVLIMDEATSALDPVVEKKIIDNIKRRGCTCVIVAHRLSTVRDCDCICVLDNGNIVQQGTHDELSSQEGIYREFMKSV